MFLSSIIRRVILGLAATAFVTTGAWAQAFTVGDIEIGHPWSRATLPGAKVAAGYASLKNNGTEPDRLVGVSAEIAGKGEPHEMAVTDGIMIMRPLKGGLEIPAGAEVMLEPGSYHIMFTDLKAPAVEGEKFKGTMTFEKAGTVEVEFAVEKPGGDDHSSNGG